MTRLVNVCPECGSGQINHRRMEPRYRCGNCKMCFPIPARKEVAEPIKIPSDQLDEIKRMFEIRIKELEKMDNPLFQGLIGVDTIILDKITAE